ncbi:MAG TPA: UPF0280 family protein [Bryobacteraceae bacterium]|nr:UPF0280 family protein [Bryobacteraceae bacterium]
MNRAPAQIALLPDGRRLHLHDGPIDLIIEAWGTAHEIRSAYAAAAERFVTILDELCAELPQLRQAASASGPKVTGVVARRMLDAVLPYAADTFMTPMAAVAGAVAEEILSAMTSATNLPRAYVNDGGDIAVHLEPGEEFTIGMVERPDRVSLFGTLKLRACDPVRGIATSGWRGRSFSLGIADAVTVLAPSAAGADAASTMIANAVDLPVHPAVTRLPACELAPDSDLGPRLVTQAVAPLSREDIELALASGANTAQSLVQRGLIFAAALHLQGKTRTVGILPRMVAKSTPARSLVHA